MRMEILFYILQSKQNHSHSINSTSVTDARAYPPLDETCISTVILRKVTGESVVLIRIAFDVITIDLSIMYRYLLRVKSKQL